MTPAERSLRARAAAFSMYAATLSSAAAGSVALSPPPDPLPAGGSPWSPAPRYPPGTARRVTPSEVRLVQAYLLSGSCKAAAARLGIRDETLRHRLGCAYARHAVAGMPALVWTCRRELEAAVEDTVPPVEARDAATPRGPVSARRSTDEAGQELKMTIEKPPSTGFPARSVTYTSGPQDDVPLVHDPPIAGAHTR
jgi:hypothetical protein